MLCTKFNIFESIPSRLPDLKVVDSMNKWMVSFINWSRYLIFLLAAIIPHPNHATQAQGGGGKGGGAGAEKNAC